MVVDLIDHDGPFCSAAGPKQANSEEASDGRLTRSLDGSVEQVAAHGESRRTSVRQRLLPFTGRVPVIVMVPVGQPAEWQPHVSARADRMSI
jgi:hypothetical protein